MLEKLKNGPKVVGTRRVLRAIRAGEVEIAFVGNDADLFILREIKEACTAANVRLVEVDSMKELGKACGIEVKTASAALLK